MAFFDDISKKLSQASQNAVGKTKDSADIFKLKNEISEEERKVVALYNEIGRLYASMHYEDYEPAFNDLMLRLKESVKAIELRQAQIQNIKNVTTCSNCGAEISRDSTFCSVCGNKKADRVDMVTPRCASCGNPIEAGSKFCTFCGTPIAVPAEPVAPVAPVNFVQPEAPVAPVSYVAPAAPVNYVQPAAPVAPVNFTAPAEPVTPVNFVQPASPVAPASYVVPTAPVAPVEAVTPDATVVTNNQ